MVRVIRYVLSLLGQIPMRHLVYRVQPLPQSLLPLVWDFGTLQSQESDSNVEKEYITRIIDKFLVGMLNMHNGNLFNTGG